MEQKENRVPFFSSMRFKILLMIAVSAVFTSGVIVAILIPTFNSMMTSTNLDYLHDMSTSYGKVMDDAYNALGEEMLTYDADILEAVDLKDGKVGDMQFICQGSCRLRRAGISQSVVWSRATCTRLC